MTFWKKPPAVAAYDRSRFRPVIRRSICTGEETACLQDRTTGQLQELSLLTSPAERAQFCQVYADGQDVPVVY